ncbi:hypothetical protein SAMN05661080_04198 [Modestobacter sp. DSM 44400]|uniref:hypothetical protein n=1 Tax=Modestobacter sp. DSM 44400 TaxID=1550230 RepID=UPI0008993B57|nr:hypothetical protein [Modestobacter sp. DSM 44400]SDY66066.1 hypothetical protein SAMN05661080_04198 [Modestobacter sp. DSM 44400]
MVNLLSSLALLACPLGMGLMMWMMMRGGGHNQPAAPQQSMTPAQQAELAQLRAELDQVRADDRDRSPRR